MPGVLKQYVGNVWTPIITGAEGATGPAGGVESIIAGDNITIDQSTGNVTINSTGGGGDTGNVNFSGYNITVDGAVEKSSSPSPTRLEIGNVSAIDTSDGNGQYGIFSFGQIVNPDEVVYGGQRYYMTTNTLVADQTTAGNAISNSSRFHTMENSLNLLGDYSSITSNSRLNAQRNWVNIGNASVASNVGNVVNTHLGLGMVQGTVENYVGLVLTGYDDDAGGTGTNQVNGIAAGIGFAWNGSIGSNGDYYNIWNAGPDNFDYVRNQTGLMPYSSYYNMRNDDPNTQEKLGALRWYTERLRDRSAGSSFELRPGNGMVQRIQPSEACSITLNDGSWTTSTDAMTHSQNVSLLIVQGGTGYAVTMPTGSNIYYANDNSDIPATAGSRTWVVCNAVANEANDGTDYYISISPEFTASA